MSNDEMEKVAKRMMDATFDFNDYLKQANMVKGMGSIAGVAKMIPGMAGTYACSRMFLLITRVFVIYT